MSLRSGAECAGAGGPGAEVKELEVEELEIQKLKVWELEVKEKEIRNTCPMVILEGKVWLADTSGAGVLVM